MVKKDGKLEGVDAVIDKDLAGERLAVDVGASIFMVLTDVDSVRLNYNTSDDKALSQITVAEAKQFAEEGHFAKGSMEPKVRAAIRFVKAGGEKAVITSLDRAFDALEGRAGTTIIKG